MRLGRFLQAGIVALGLMTGMAASGMAAVEGPFTQAAFDASKHEGKPVLVYISATWCPTCAKQKPILDSLEKDPAFKDLVIYHVDFDTQKDIVRQMGVQRQSTLVVFHGEAEKGRSTGDTNAESLRALVEKANS